MACLVPVIIMPYYCVIGGWVLKYFVAFLTGDGSNVYSVDEKDFAKLTERFLGIDELNQ